MGAVETSGIALHRLDDGKLGVAAQRFAVRQLDLRARALAIDVASVAVTGFAARFEQGEPARLLEASAEEVRIEGMNAYLDEAPAGMAAKGGLRLDALAELDGTVRAYLTDALWIIDAEIVVPIVQGVVDFNRVVVEHIGPNSSLSIGPRSIHVDAPHRQRIDLFTFDEHGAPVRCRGRRVRRAAAAATAAGSRSPRSCKR